MNQQIAVPLIGQGNQAVMGLRLQIASQIVGQLAVVDFSSGLRKATDANEVLGNDSEKLEFSINSGMVASAAVAYADALLAALGLIRSE
jgi:hypothetical protein